MIFFNQGFSFVTFYGLTPIKVVHFCAKYKHQNNTSMEGSSTTGASATSASTAASNGGEGGNTNATQTQAESTNKAEVKTEKAETSQQTETKEEKKNESKEEKKEKTQKDLFYERHKKDYPDDDEADEELFYKRHNERTKEYDKLKKSDDDFRKVISEHPQFGGMFLDAADGKDFFESLLGRFSKEDILAAYDDPEKSKKLSETYANYLKGQEESKKLREEGENNIRETISRFSKYCEKNDIGEEEMASMWQQMNDFYSDGLKGKYSDKLFDMMRKAATHDADVENARQEGELKGHNAKVQATLAKGKAPQGLPPTFDGGQGGTAPEPKPKNKKIVRNPFTNEDMEFDE